MDVLQIVIGVGLLLSGSAVLLLRHRLEQRDRDRAGSAIGTRGYVVMGTVLTAAGVLQIAVTAL